MGLGAGSAAMDRAIAAQLGQSPAGNKYNTADAPPSDNVQTLTMVIIQQATEAIQRATAIAANLSGPVPSGGEAVKEPVDLLGRLQLITRAMNFLNSELDRAQRALG